MRRISYWILSTVSAAVLLFGFDASRHGISSPVAATPPFSSSATTGGPSGSSSSGHASQGSKQSAGRTTVTGAVAQTQWGPVQVQLVVNGGTITKVSVLQYPHGNSLDAQINSYALPILIKETTAHQSANIDMVSGATVTSTGYLQSLQSAIDQAKL